MSVLIFSTCLTFAVWAHKSCLRNEYQGFDSFISAVCSSSSRQDDLQCWVFALDGQMNSVIYVYLHLALQTKAGRNSFLNICPSACWWAFLFGRNFKVIVNHKYLKIASPLIKQPQKHFNDRRHESDLLASVLHTLYSLQIKVLVMHKVTHFRLFHDSLFMMHVVLVIVPR